MGKPTGKAVAAIAVAAVGVGHTYEEMDCQAFIEYCVQQAGGSMVYRGSNAMYRSHVYLATIDNAKAEGKLVPGAGLLIVDEVSASTPAKYREDGLGDATHIGLYVGENALTDTDKNGKSRKCNVVHSGATMGRVAGSTLKNGWTHVMLFKEIDYGIDVPAGVVLGGAVDAADTVKSDPEGTGVAASGAQKPDVSTFYKVKKGSLGGAVRRLQTWLQDLGYTLSDDGEFGPATDNAVRYFQEEKGLVVDGVVGQATWQALADARWSAMEQ